MQIRERSMKRVLMCLFLLLLACQPGFLDRKIVGTNYEVMIVSNDHENSSPALTIEVVDVEADAFGLANVVVNGDRLDILTDTIISREVEEGLLSVSATYIGKQAVQIDPVFLSQGDSVLLLLKMIDLSEPIVNDFNREELRKQLKERIDTSKK